jgi:hypothetical protein
MGVIGVIDVTGVDRSPHDRAPQVLIPYDPETKEAIPLKEAAARAGRSESTIKNWCRDHHIGRRVGGGWMVSQVALAMFLDGDQRTLRAYLAGDRSSDLVKPYFDRFGLESALRSAVAFGA